LIELNHIYNMDCLEGMRQMEPNTIDSIVTDPPYALVGGSRGGSLSIGDKTTPFGRSGPSKNGVSIKKGFMGKEWDGKLPGIETWEEALRVAKPGAHMLAFGGTRTHHRLMVAIEDAGWEIRDCLMWVYGSGFPKSLDVSKAIDKAAGVEREVVGQRQDILQKQAADIQRGKRKIADSFDAGAPERNNGFVTISADITAPATDAAKQWNGWGTALKPAWEPIILCRKPLEGTVANNVQKWGVGGINIDGGRVSTTLEETTKLNNGWQSNRTLRAGEVAKGFGMKPEGLKDTEQNPLGRFPANIIHDGSEEVLEPFPDSKGQCGDLRAGIPKQAYNCYGDYGQTTEMRKRNDSGSAARFFYCAKASKSERGADNKHPTVKPLALMRYLCKLITPQKGIVLDPFMGSGSTGVAAYQEGFNFTGFELEKDSFETADLRIKNAKVQDKLGEWFE